MKPLALWARLLHKVRPRGLALELISKGFLSHEQFFKVQIPQHVKVPHLVHKGSLLAPDKLLSAQSGARFSLHTEAKVKRSHANAWQPPPSD